MQLNIPVRWREAETLAWQCGTGDATLGTLAQIQTREPDSNSRSVGSHDCPARRTTVARPADRRRADGGAELTTALNTSTAEAE
ncbi:hypothetical protein E2C01_037692 [Portunus trituberculatus]|uniref:Uncharacterized protein n=1 Tax=Portunus trituberculatus TaxID=210409 RepID=A0A5B7FFZ5_PORTR|nr:hypothetical protein [Portunus trituberculatus]